MITALFVVFALGILGLGAFFIIKNMKQSKKNKSSSASDNKISPSGDAPCQVVGTSCKGGSCELK